MATAQSHQLQVLTPMSGSPRQLIDTKVTVETPEGVDFQFRIAGPGLRASAWLTDQLVKVLIVAGVLLLFVLLTYAIELEFSLPEISFGFAMFSWFVVDWFYGGLAEGLFDGQTYGKRKLQLRVVRTNGTPVDLLSAIGRNFLRTADFLPIAFSGGLLVMICTRRMQRLGDLFFDTMVIEERRLTVSRPAKLLSKVERLQRSECRHRFQVPDRTLSVIERLFDPARAISDARREEIAAPLGNALEQYMGFEEAGPDPDDPYQYFQKRGLRHTRFLLRTMKTFSLVDEDQQDKTAASPQEGRKHQSRPVGDSE
jgi:uncharacterized RDD family membrane protein YckC